MKREIKTKKQTMASWTLVILLTMALPFPRLWASEYCFEEETIDCLQKGRFELKAFFINSNERYQARVRDALIGDATTLFYFFSFNNPELMIKVIDGCGINGYYWVFASAATDLKYSFRIYDYLKQRFKSYSPRQGDLVSDVSAFSCR